APARARRRAARRRAGQASPRGAARARGASLHRRAGEEAHRGRGPPAAAAVESEGTRAARRRLVSGERRPPEERGPALAPAHPLPPRRRRPPADRPDRGARRRDALRSLAAGRRPLPPRSRQARQEGPQHPHLAPGRLMAPRVVIVGGGFGGLYAARALRKAPVAVTLVDRSNHHLFQPLLYQVATAAPRPPPTPAPLPRLPPRQPPAAAPVG